MKARRFGEAIAVFEAHLAEWPDDVRALLRLGLCHLLDSSEETFVAIHGRARALIEKLREVPTDLARLWAHYQQLLRKVSATALVVGAMALPACQPPPTRAPWPPRRPSPCRQERPMRASPLPGTRQSGHHIATAAACGQVRSRPAACASLPAPYSEISPPTP
jgi:hypothetical protein